jgi:hypothetical protein
MTGNDYRVSLRTFTPSTRLSGHGLWSEGWPVEATPGHGQGWRPLNHRSGPGRALCECGEMSPELPSANARKRWHGEHKEQVRREQADATQTGGEPG